MSITIPDFQKKSITHLISSLNNDNLSYTKNRLFIDIETVTVNRQTKKPSELVTTEYSLNISYLDNDYNLYNIELVTFIQFFETLNKGLTKKTKLILVAHNANGYENHFIYNTLLELGCIEYNQKDSKMIKKDKQSLYSSKTEIKGSKWILSKRVKSKSKIDIAFRYDRVEATIEDTYTKSNASLATIGRMLVRAEVMPEQYLKSSYDYTKYDKEELLTPEQLKNYVYTINDNLTEEELLYIRNDTIILVYFYVYFHIIFKGFDYEKQTYTLNIIDSYTKYNSKTEFQLLNRYKIKDKPKRIEYSTYLFDDMTLYDYYKHYFKGGLNFYNDKYLGKIIEDLFSIDLNSSYPYVMYSKEFPKMVLSYSQTKFTTDIDKLDDSLYLFRIEIKSYIKIINSIKSKVVRQMFIKYFATDNKSAYLTNVHIETIKQFCDIRTLKNVTILSYIEFSKVKFHGKKELNYFYKVKTLGKSKVELIYNTPLDIKATNISKKEASFSDEEIYISKVKMNGIYGAPALRAYFDYFTRLSDGSYQNHKQGYKNNERNILFSVFVTSYALQNLLAPLTYFKEKIDEYFAYSDTDSLYLKKEALSYLPKSLFDKYILGKWDIEHDNIEKFYILNHKKYSYYAEDKIQIRCAGVTLDNFNTNNISFENFVKTQFSDKVIVKSKGSILNKGNTISIYDRDVEMQQGKDYPDKMSIELVRMKDEIIKKIKEIEGVELEYSYIESNAGFIGANDLIEPAKVDNTLKPFSDFVIDYNNLAQRYL